MKRMSINRSKKELLRANQQLLIGSQKIIEIAEKLLKELDSLPGDEKKYREYVKNDTTRIEFITDCVRQVSEHLDNWQMQAIYINAMNSMN